MVEHRESADLEGGIGSGGKTAKSAIPVSLQAVAVNKHSGVVDNEGQTLVGADDLKCDGHLGEPRIAHLLSVPKMNVRIDDLPQSRSLQVDE